MFQLIRTHVETNGMPEPAELRRSTRVKPGMVKTARFDDTKRRPACNALSSF